MAELFVKIIEYYWVDNYLHILLENGETYIVEDPYISKIEFKGLECNSSDKIEIGNNKMWS